MHRIEAEHHAGLADDVDELLEDVGDAVVPHRHAEQVLVGGREAFESPSSFLPRDSLLTCGSLAGEDRHLGASCAGTECWKAAVPKVEGIDLDLWASVAQ